MAAVARIIVNG